MLPEGRRPEGNITQLLTEANSQYLFCYITEKKKELYRIPHSALPAYSNW